MALINSIDDLSPKAKMELVQFLEPWFQAKLKGIGGTDDLDDVLFNSDNLVPDPRYLTVTANQDIPGDDASIHLEAAGDVGDFFMKAKGDISAQGTTAELSGTTSAGIAGGVVDLTSGTTITLDPGTDAVINLLLGATLRVASSTALLFGVVASAFSGGGNSFSVVGDQTAFFGTGVAFHVFGSFGNDGSYIVASSSFGGGNTVIVVTGSVGFGSPSPITAVVTGAGGSFTFLGNYTAPFGIGSPFSIVGSTGNDGAYTVATITHLTGPTRTRVTVTTSVPNATADGDFELELGTISLDGTPIFEVRADGSVHILTGETVQADL